MRIENNNALRFENIFTKSQNHINNRDKDSKNIKKEKNINNKSSFKINKKNQSNAMQSLLETKSQLEESLENLKKQQNERISEYKMKIDEINEQIYTPTTKMRNEMIEGFLTDYDEFVNSNNSDDSEEQEFWGCSSKDELVDKIYSLDIEDAVVKDDESENTADILTESEQSLGSKDLKISDIDKNNSSGNEDGKFDEDIAFEKQALSYCNGEDKENVAMLANQKVQLGLELASYIAESQKQINEVQKELENVNASIQKLTVEEKENKSGKKDKNDENSKKYDAGRKVNDKHKILQKIRMNLDSDLLRQIDINKLVDLL